MPGMHWTVNGADAIIAPRCAEAGSRREATGNTLWLTLGFVTCKFCLTGDREWMRP